MNNLRPIKLLSAREMVASNLRKAILSRELQEGDVVTLESIATRLGVSNTPVREAFQMLASDGLIKLRSNKGAVVLGVTRKTICDHYQVRALLESQAVAIVCASDVDITEIVNAYEAGKHALEINSTKEYTMYNQAFHSAIWDAAGNEKMASLLSSMWNGLSMAHKITEEAYAKISMAEHEKILEAIKQRDVELGKQRMNDHITRSMNNILTRFD